MYCLNVKPLNFTVLFVTSILASTLSAQAIAPWVGVTLNNAPCRGGGQGAGPYDYLRTDQYISHMKKVDLAHFSANVEQLKGASKGRGRNPLPDLDYTLRAIPNHHRALNTAIRYHARVTSSGVSYSLRSPVECYLQRAINFSPKDASAMALYAIFLHKQGQYDQAEHWYQNAEALSPTDLQIKYNYGLLLIKLDKLEDARNMANFVYQHGYPLQGLKKILESSAETSPLSPHREGSITTESEI